MNELSGHEAPTDRGETDRPPRPGRGPFDARQVPFLDLLGVRSIELREGWCRIELPVLRRHLRSVKFRAICYLESQLSG